MKPVLWKIEDGIGFLTLNRPPGNLMDAAFFDELARLATEVVPESGARALIVAGAGRHFSAGADLKAMVREITNPGNKASRLPGRLENNLAAFEAIERFPGPVIAAVRGACLGSGFELALACPRRIAAHGSVFGLPESTFGLIPGCGGIQRLSEAAGARSAAEIALGGRTFGAEEALSLGIVSRLVQAGDLMSAAVAEAGPACGRAGRAAH